VPAGLPLPPKLGADKAELVPNDGMADLTEAGSKPAKPADGVVGFVGWAIVADLAGGSVAAVEEPGGKPKPEPEVPPTGTRSGCAPLAAGCGGTPKRLAGLALPFAALLLLVGCLAAAAPAPLLGIEKPVIILGLLLTATAGLLDSRDFSSRRWTG
jgi:hypothetical protein